MPPAPGALPSPAPDAVLGLPPEPGALPSPAPDAVLGLPLEPGALPSPAPEAVLGLPLEPGALPSPAPDAGLGLPPEPAPVFPLFFEGFCSFTGAFGLCTAVVAVFCFPVAAFDLLPFANAE